MDRNFGEKFSFYELSGKVWSKKLVGLAGAGGEDVEVDAQVVKVGKRVATVKVDFRRVRTADVVASGRLIAVSATLQEADRFGC